MAGITAIGFPDEGMTKNQGRVGLCQNGVRKPVKYRTSGSVITRMASNPCAVILDWAARVRVSNSM